MAGIGSGFQNGEEKARRLGLRSKGFSHSQSYRYPYIINSKTRLTIFSCCLRQTLAILTEPKTIMQPGKVCWIVDVIPASHSESQSTINGLQSVISQL